MFEGLRAELDALGLTAFDASLPGEDLPVAAREGALRVRQDGDEFLLETVDYGTGYRLLSASTGIQARDMVLAYVSRPLPSVRPLPRSELDAIVGRIARH